MAPSQQMSRFRRLFASTGAPPQTRLVAYLVCGAAAGAALGVIFSPQKGAVLAALTGALIAAAGSHGPSRVALRVAGFATVTAVVFVLVAFLVAGHPWWAAAAIAAVAIATSALAGAGPVGAGLAQLGLLIYVLAMVVGAIVHLGDVPLASGVLRIVLGAAGGLAVVAVAARLRDRRDREAAAAAPRPPSPWPALLASLRSFDEHARDGVRRAIPLAIGVYLFERSGSHDALWVFLSAFVVLMPTGKSPMSVALARVISTIVGAVVLGLFALALPVSALHANTLLILAVVAILFGVTFRRTYPFVAGGLTAAGAILLVGAPSGAIGVWAEHRLLDTALGCALALASMYLLWPKDKPDVGGAGSAGPAAQAPEAAP